MTRTELLAKAHKCDRLADAFPDDEAASNLRALAEELRAQAAALSLDLAQPVQPIGQVGQIN